MARTASNGVFVRLYIDADISYEMRNNWKNLAEFATRTESRGLHQMGQGWQSVGGLAARTMTFAGLLSMPQLPLNTGQRCDNLFALRCQFLAALVQNQPALAVQLAADVGVESVDAPG